LVQTFMFVAVVAWLLFRCELEISNCFFQMYGICVTSPRAMMIQVPCNIFLSSCNYLLRTRHRLYTPSQ
jgi:hypothetical protein